MSTLICNACQSGISSDAERAVHYKSEWHRYNVKRRCAGLTSIPQALFDQQLAALNSKKAAEASQKATQQCKACKKSFATSSAYQAHIASKKHLKKVEKQENNAAADDDDDDEESDATAAASSSAATAVPAASASTSAAGASKKAESKHDSDDEDDATMSDGEESEEGEAIPLLHCLFCTKEFKDVSASVEHMLKQHGFFIPFVENLVDLEGLLTYLGEKIGIGHVCLWCNGKGKARYPSTQAVQMHMKAKSHCKLALEQEDDEEELMDYYDFDLDEDEDDEDMAEGDEADEKGSSAAAGSSSSSTAVVAVAKEEPARRAGGGGASSINDAGELVLADGSIVGSRVHKRIYKQHIRPARAEELNAIAANYKRLALSTDVRENPRIYRRKKEMFHQRARKREDLAKGLAANVQHHFRAQVSY